MITYFKHIILIPILTLGSCNLVERADETSSSFEREECVIKVATFNIGHFSNGKFTNPDGTYSNLLDYKRKLDRIGADVLAINENSAFFDKDNTINVSDLYSEYQYKIFGSSHNYDFNSLLSKFYIKESKEAQFSNSESRYYIDSVIIADEILIHVVVTHLDLDDIEKRSAQIGTLLDLVHNYDTFIICGDMNPSSKIKNIAGDDPLSQYKKDYSRFVDAGYKLANCGDFGEFNTLVKWEGSKIYPWDNIIVSPNINIVSVKRENIVLSDHYPLTATIRFVNNN